MKRTDSDSGGPGEPLQNGRTLKSAQRLRPPQRAEADESLRMRGDDPDRLGQTADLGEFRRKVHDILRRHWVDVPPGSGYTAPNPERYPWQWLWDSCFHALIWAELGDDRGVEELTQAFASADASGCVPHMRYQLEPRCHEDLWGRREASSLTGPPMYGHAVAELCRRGVPVPEKLIAQAADALRFLLERRWRDEASGLLEICHPWESGADDDPRWDDYCPGGFEPSRWAKHKRELMADVERDSNGAPLRNSAFKAASVGFSALTAFNALELAEATDALDAGAAHRLAEAVRERWNAERLCYGDAGEAAGGSGLARTAYGLLAMLVESDEGRLRAAASELLSPGGFGGEFGMAGVHRDEKVYDSRTYWRGPSWPQLNYLLWLGMRRGGLDVQAAAAARTSRAGSEASGWAESWDCDDAAAVGAVPQSWAGLAILF